jgi:hypothetical protein
MQIIRSVFSSVFRKAIPDGDWILAEGVWDGNGRWIDTATWNDGG